MKNNKVYKFLTSIRFAVILMAIITVLCVVYTLIPQNQTLSVYQNRYGTSLAAVLTSLGLDHVLTSPWMYVSGLLFVLNLGLCTIRRFGFALRHPGKNIRTWGSPVLHVGLCVVLFGAVLSLFSGRTLYFEIPVGQSAEFTGRKGAFRIKAERFDIEYYEDAVTPKQYRTNLQIEQNGNVTEAQAYVNGPVRFDGATIIQQSFGWMLNASVSTGSAQKTLRAKDGETVLLLGEEMANYTITMHFYPDYDETKGMEQTPGQAETNPHILWVVNDGEEAVSYGVCAIGETQVIGEPLSITFDAYERYTGLQVKYDPGIKVIFAGFLLSFLGLVIRYAPGTGKKKEEVQG